MDAALYSGRETRGELDDVHPTPTRSRRSLLRKRKRLESCPRVLCLKETKLSLQTMDVDADDDAVAGYDGLPLLPSLTTPTTTASFDIEGTLHRLVLPELGPEGNYNLKALLRLCCGKRGVDNTAHGLYSLPMGCGGEVVMRVPASGRGSVTGVLSEKKEAFAKLDLDVIRREVPACLRNPVTRNGVPSKGEITSPSGTQVLAQVRSTRIDGFQPLTFTLL